VENKQKKSANLTHCKDGLGESQLQPKQFGRALKILNHSLNLYNFFACFLLLDLSFSLLQKMRCKLQLGGNCNPPTSRTFLTLANKSVLKKETFYTHHI